MANIHSLSNINNTEENDKKIEEYSQRGGSSSTAVMRSTDGIQRDSSSDDKMTHLIEKAKKYKPDGKSPPSSDIQITIYRNGFIAGNGPFRPSSDPQNQKLLDTMLKGELPKELETDIKNTIAPNQQKLGVELINKKNEDFYQTVPRFQPFKGAGQTLISSSSPLSSVFADTTPQKVTVNPNTPTTLLQLVLSNRQKIRQNFNNNHTVLDIYRHFQFVSGISSFSLIEGFPPKPLVNPNITIKEAGLMGASITQRV